MWPHTTGTPAGTGGRPRAGGGSPGLRRAGGATRGHTPPSRRARRGEDPRGKGHATGGLMRCPGLGPAPSPSRDRDLARPEDGDEAQAPLLAHWAACDVCAGQAEQEGRRARLQRQESPVLDCPKWLRLDQEAGPSLLSGPPGVAPRAVPARLQAWGNRAIMRTPVTGAVTVTTACGPATQRERMPASPP